jgi:hypothetical protein
MTIPYNASTSSIIEYIKDNFDKKKNPNYFENLKTDFFFGEKTKIIIFIN